jgi:hypothetical protein
MRQQGAFIPFLAIAVVGLLALVGLVIDGARLFISMTQNNKIARIAAQLAIREYSTYVPSGSANAEDQHQQKMKHVNEQVANLLNDELNSIFGYSGKEVVKLASSKDKFDEGLILTPGVYYLSADDIPDPTLRGNCPDASPENGCWVPYQAGGGVNSFRAEVLTPTSSVIKMVLLRLLSDQEFKLSDEAFSYLKPRIFLNLVDMSESITEGNFNSFGRYRSKFLFRFNGTNGASGAACISPPRATYPSCSFYPIKDDQVWNGEFYSNDFSVPDERCQSLGAPDCLLVERRMCPNSGVSDKEYAYRWALGHHTWVSGIFGEMSHVPACSPVFWTERPNIKGPCGRRSCFDNNSYQPYGYRFLGDTRPKLIYENGVSRQPHFFRFKTDYFNHRVALTRGKLNQNSEITETGSIITGSYLVEDPAGIRNDNYSQREKGWAPSNGYNHGSPPDPDGYFKYEGCDYGGEAGNWYSCDRRRGYMMHRLQPDYEGPEPYNSILKGLWYIHRRTAEQNIPGDKFGVLFFDSTLTSFKSQIPLTPVIREGATPSPDQEKLHTLLEAINPTKNTPFWARNRIQERLNLGLFPDPLAPETNISHAIALAVKYLKAQPNFRGADIYLNLFTDFIAFSHCNFKDGVTDSALEACTQVTGLNSDKAPPGDSAPQRLMGMLNDLIGWPRPNGERQKGLITYLKEQGIKPIFFAFNGTIGGEPLYPHPTEDRCLTRTEVRENTLNFNPPLPLNFTSAVENALVTDRFDRVVRRYVVQGGLGNFYLYSLGDMMDPLLKAYGDLIQLMRPCPRFTGKPSALTRLNNYCANHPLKGVLNNGAPMPADTHFSRGNQGDGSVCKQYWYQNDPNWPNQSHMWWGRKRIEMGIDCAGIDWSDGVVLSNPNIDFGDNGYNGQTFPWHRRCDVNRTGPDGYNEERCQKDTPTIHGYAWNRIDKHALWGLTHYPEIPHIDISHAGGLRCEPRMDPENPTKPYGIDKQIEEKIKYIIREPNIVIIGNPHIIG